jgi:hypothetical protein
MQSADFGHGQLIGVQTVVKIIKCDYICITDDLYSESVQRCIYDYLNIFVGLVDILLAPRHQLHVNIINFITQLGRRHFDQQYLYVVRQLMAKLHHYTVNVV